MKQSLIIALYSFIFSLTLTACTDRDSCIYKSDIKNELSVSAKMTPYYFLDESETKKCDTILSSDTMIFMGDIYPSKYTHFQEYFWTLDNKRFASEYNFSTNISEPGLHEILFSVVDYFGDTISDTLFLQVSNRPIIDYSNFIPALGSQGFSPQEEIIFSWNGYDPDSISSPIYHFDLAKYENFLDSNNAQNISTIYKTTLTSTSFTYQGNLEPFSHYRWRVWSENEFFQQSDSIIVGDFYTKGFPQESGINIIFNNSSHKEVPITFKVLDNTNKEVFRKNFTKYETWKSSEFIIAPLAPGDYKIVGEIPLYSDFKLDTISIKLLPDEIYLTNELTFTDSIAPTVQFFENGLISNKDTLEFADTLAFLIFENGGGIETNHNSIIYPLVYLDGESLKSHFEIKKDSIKQIDTLLVMLPESQKSFAPRLLTISPKDLSNNVAYKTFVISPSLIGPQAKGDNDENL